MIDTETPHFRSHFFIQFIDEDHDDRRPLHSHTRVLSYAADRRVCVYGNLDANTSAYSGKKPPFSMSRSTVYELVAGSRNDSLLF